MVTFTLVFAKQILAIVFTVATLWLPIICYGSCGTPKTAPAIHASFYGNGTGAMFTARNISEDDLPNVVVYDADGSEQTIVPEWASTIGGNGKYFRYELTGQERYIKFLIDDVIYTIENYDVDVNWHVDTDDGGYRRN